MASILITGANRGIGLEFVRQLASREDSKWKCIFATCRNPDKAEDVKQIAANHPSVKLVELDVTNDATIEAAVQQVSSVVGEDGLNVIINNAGIVASRQPIPLGEVTREMLHKVFDVNAAGALMVTQKFLSLLRKGAAASKVSGFSFFRGGIFNISSGLGSIADNTSSGKYPYRVSKAALTMMTKSFSVDLKADNILAIALLPGWVKTDMGGSNARLTVEESVSMLLNVMATFGEEENGKVMTYNGEVFPY